MTSSERRRVAVVTGAAAGIGRALAERLAADGMDVVVADLAPADDVVAAIRGNGGDAVAVQGDIATQSGADQLRDAARDVFGVVDVVVNNAGIYPTRGFFDLDLAEWRRVLSNNLDSLFLVTSAFLPGMREQGWGRVVCMSSTAFHAGSPGFCHYVTSKGGVTGFVRALASEVGSYGVTVNALAPSIVRTEGTTRAGNDELGVFDLLASQQAIQRTQTPQDLTGAVSFLVSDEAPFITGQTLVVDGGYVRT